MFYLYLEQNLNDVNYKSCNKKLKLTEILHGYCITSIHGITVLQTTSATAVP